MLDYYADALRYITPLQQPVPEWLEIIKRAGIARKVPIVRDDMGQFLKLICSLITPEWILEIGCGISYSTHWMLLGSPQSKIIALDTNQDRLNQCKTHLERSGFQDRVTLVHQWAEEFFDQNRQKFDLIFQDATKKEYIKMLEPMHTALKTGGTLIVDNIFYGGKVLGMSIEERKKYAKGVALLEEFNQVISQHTGFETTFLPLSDGTLIAKRID
jgi:predicted O-methyltransferase YrrM